MKVLENATKKVYEIGLFEDVVWEHALKIRLLEVPLVFGNLGVDVGFLEILEDYGEGGCCIFDEAAIHFFELYPDDPLEDLLCGPHEALKTIIYASPRFQAVKGDEGRA